MVNKNELRGEIKYSSFKVVVSCYKYKFRIEEVKNKESSGIFSCVYNDAIYYALGRNCHQTMCQVAC